MIFDGDTPSGRTNVDVLQTARGEYDRAELVQAFEIPIFKCGLTAKPCVLIQSAVIRAMI
ncbi:MAG: hypothetical protein CBE00_05625 [Planctomycetaceae bacterium TMED240]|nr:hypothetical protein [Rhodopirellula sp.]OUX07223.1 MAG: hypothetical protein CBE00_05625 [Planctomycetaceae bacterium TMED240]